jgi:hypothetical protein
MYESVIPCPMFPRLGRVLSGFGSTSRHATAFCSPFVFITLRIAFPITPLYLHPYKTPGGWAPLSGICAPNSVTSVLRFCFQLLCCQQIAASCALLALFSALPPFVFNRLQPLFLKHPGGGGALCDSPASPLPRWSLPRASKSVHGGKLPHTRLSAIIRLCTPRVWPARACR